MSRHALALALLASLWATAAAAQVSDVPRLLTRADAAFAAGDTAAARLGYEAVLERAPDQSRAIYQLALLHPAGSAAQLRLLARYAVLEPDDAWGFAALGQAHHDAGDEDAARTAYRRALRLAPDAPDIRALLARVEPPAARPSFWLEPLSRVAEDSDGNRLTRLGARAELRGGGGASLAAEGARLTVGDGLSSVDGWEALVTGAWRPHAALRLSGGAGVLGAMPFDGGAAVREPLAHGRIRWQPAGGVMLQLRGRHGPVTATPLLLGSGVVLSEMRGTVDLPVVGPLHARGVGRLGRLSAAGETNSRTMWGAGPVLRLGPLLELNALGGRSAYARPSAAGYFAYERVDALDVGVYWEKERWPLTVALDAGGGAERIKRFNEPAGAWGRALRLWGLAGWALSERAELRLETEAYESRAGEAVAAATGGWSWGSLSLSLAVRP